MRGTSASPAVFGSHTAPRDKPVRPGLKQCRGQSTSCCRCPHTPCSPWKGTVVYYNMGLLIWKFPGEDSSPGSGLSTSSWELFWHKNTYQ